MIQILKSLFFATTAHAAPLLEGVNAPTEADDIANLLDRVYNILWTMAGVAAFAAILYAAGLFFLANGDQTKITKARTALLYAVMGAGLIFISKFAIIIFIKLFGGNVV